VNQAGKSLKKLIYAVKSLDSLILTNKTSPLLRLELHLTKRRKEIKLQTPITQLSWEHKGNQFYPTKKHLNLPEMPCKNYFFEPVKDRWGICVPL